FDSVSREVCTARRGATNTPIQSLVLLNDIQFVEAARVLAEETLRHSVEPSERIRFAFRTLAGRNPLPEELRLLETLYARQRQLYSSDSAAAEKLIKIGERK